MILREWLLGLAGHVALVGLLLVGAVLATMDLFTADLRDTVHATIRPDRLGVWLRVAGR